MAIIGAAIIIVMTTTRQCISGAIMATMYWSIKDQEIKFI